MNHPTGFRRESISLFSAFLLGEVAKEQGPPGFRQHLQPFGLTGPPAMVTAVHQRSGFGCQVMPSWSLYATGKAAGCEGLGYDHPLRHGYYMLLHYATLANMYIHVYT